ncbi:unnamed protein product [Onchocerca flexuosa]|uniref:Uncharacterized protein n=1 Tax=Onchocerca flexuosa TaxID=387005 RepID=A0A183HA45_9BILA|nr:unnamed protein product [Onchocerca flexuosa]
MRMPQVVRNLVFHLPFLFIGNRVLFSQRMVFEQNGSKSKSLYKKFQFSIESSQKAIFIKIIKWKI